MIHKIDLDHSQFDSLKRFLESDENRIKPPEGYRFAVMAKYNGEDALVRVNRCRLVSFLGEPRNVGGFMSVTLQLHDHAYIVKDDQRLRDAATLMFPNTGLLKVLEIAKRLPPEAIALTAAERAQATWLVH